MATKESGHIVVRCTQCCHVFCKPKLLPCLHTFCETCIFKVRDEAEKGKVFSCPVTTCKEEVTKGNDDFPDNILVANIINAKSVACSTKGMVKCTSCDNLLEASHRCLDCQRFLCVNCHAAHKHMQIFRRHRMQDISEFFRQQQAQKRPLYCTKHQGETLELFCETSGVLCCSKCVEENTTIPRNKYKSPEEIAASCRKTLRSSISVLEKKMTNMDGERDRYDRALALLLEKQNRAEAEIVRSTSDLISKVEEAKQCCLAELSSVVDEKRALLLETKEQMLQHYCRGEHSCTQARSLLALATDTELLCLVEKFQQRLEELTSCDVQCDLENTLSLYFHSAEVSVETLKDSLGYLQTGHIIPEEVLAAGDGIAMATAGEEEMVTIATGCDHVETMMGAICAELVDPAGVVTQAAVHDNFNGTYSLYYTPQLPGPHRLSVKISGHHIRGSPFTVHVSPAPSLSSCQTVVPLKTTEGRNTKAPGEVSYRRWNQESKREAINRITKHLGKPNIKRTETPRKLLTEGNGKPNTVKSSVQSVGDPSTQKDRAGAESLAVVKQSSKSETDMGIMATPPPARKTDGDVATGDEDANEEASISSSCGSPVKSDSDANNNNRGANPWLGPRRKLGLDGAWSLSRHSSPEKSSTKTSEENHDNESEVADGTCGKFKFTDTFTFPKLYSDVEQEEKENKDSSKSDKTTEAVPQSKFELPRPPCTADNSNNIPTTPDCAKAPIVNGEVKEDKLEEGKTSEDKISVSEEISTVTTPEKETAEVSNANENTDKLSEKPKDSKAKLRFSIDEVMPKGKLWKSTTGKLVAKFGKGGTQSGDFSFPIGVAVDSSGDIFVTDTGNHRVQVFDGQGQYKFMFGCQGNRDGEFLRPSAIVIAPTGEIVVKDNKKIQVFDCTGRFLWRFGDNVLRAPFGLALTAQGHVATVIAPRQDPAAVLIFTLTGDLVQRSLYEPVQGRPNKLRFLAVSQEKLIVSDLGNDTVYVTTLDGKLELQFGSHGIGDGMLSEPAGLDVDGSGNIIIADSVQTQGEFYCHVELSEKIARPSDIALTDDGHLIVVNYVLHTIKKYKLGE